MTVEELGQLIKSKVPKYASLPDAEVGVKAALKFPAYRDKITGNAERIEPGVYGETAPFSQKLLENTITAGSGVLLPGAVAGIPKVIRSIGNAYDSAVSYIQNPVARGLLQSTKKLGESFNAQNEAVGITRRVPVEGGRVAKFDAPERLVPTRQPRPITPAEPLPDVVPKQYPKDTGSFLNYANAKLKGLGNKISPQELTDWKVKIQTDISSGKIPKFDPETKRITTVYQQAVDLSKRITSQLNKTIEPALKEANLPKGTIRSRADLNRAFSVSAGKENVGRLLKKGVKYALGGGLAYQLGKRALDIQ